MALQILAVILAAILTSGCDDPNQEQVNVQEQQDVPDIDARAATNVEPERNLICIGDNIEDAREILDAFGKNNHIGGFAFAKGPEDIENIFIQLDADNMNGCVWYSKSSKKITRLSIVCFPNRRSGRTSHSWIPIESIELSEDGTYTVKFQKPLTPAELDAREKEAAENRREPQIPRSTPGQ